MHAERSFLERDEVQKSIVERSILERHPTDFAARRHHNRDGPGRLLGRDNLTVTPSDNDIDVEVHQFRGQGRQVFWNVVRRANHEVDVAAFDVAKLAQSRHEGVPKKRLHGVAH